MMRIPLTLCCFLMACEVAPHVPATDPAADQCGASGLQDLVGQSKDVLAAMTFPAPMRIIGPDTAVTMDYHAGRLNISHDATGTIQRVTCG